MYSSVAKMQLLPDAKWTRLNPENREKHFVLVSASAKTGRAQLQAVISRSVYNLESKILFNRCEWVPGWK